MKLKEPLEHVIVPENVRHSMQHNSLMRVFKKMKEITKYKQQRVEQILRSSKYSKHHNAFAQSVLTTGHHLKS